ncbi:PAN2-PAN3 deadenylation complex catalytic subunit PAN2-like, partial [Homalodisca vitripennis]|uniref:PAN2-PAN3 deadenylation complex catalytic subunit PAN2-like n=1 Tax=Homalodisca vitripennis TaxID=197043 RepID=UPI001EECACD1
HTSLHLPKQRHIQCLLSAQPEFADPIEPFDSISITDSLAILSSVPLVYTSPPTTMLSDWPKKFLKNVCRPTPPIDPSEI